MANAHFDYNPEEVKESITYFDLNTITRVIKEDNSIGFWDSSNNKIASIILNARGDANHQIMVASSLGWSYASKESTDQLRQIYLNKQTLNTTN